MEKGEKAKGVRGGRVLHKKEGHPGSGRKEGAAGRIKENNKRNEREGQKVFQKSKFMKGAKV